MTSTIVIDAGSAPAQPPTQSRAAGGVARRGVTFGGILRSERIKLTSLRSIKLTLLITVIVGIGLSAAIGLLFSNDMRAAAEGSGGQIFGGGDEGLQYYLLTVSTFAAPFLALIFGVLGVFAISSEYSSGMILSTLAAVPKRTPVFAGKAVVLGIVSALTALVLVAGGLVVAVLCYPESAAQLGTSMVISGALGTVAYLVLISFFAFGVSVLLRSTAGGIAVVAGVTFVLPIAFQMLSMTGWEWVTTVSEYLPAQLGTILAQGTIEVASGPNFTVAALAMVVWAAVVMLPAAVVFKRRDAR
ncbi:ABC transporter permease subunit [Leucobacter sp. USCH14]|uniref:ABC transporter permease subunit n=1 Tax=Leucobacter sp. USCH14 TaxID=3024838 RepID=UPI0030A60263